MIHYNRIRTLYFSNRRQTVAGQILTLLCEMCKRWAPNRDESILKSIERNEARNKKKKRKQKKAPNEWN